MDFINILTRRPSIKLRGKLRFIDRRRKIRAGLTEDSSRDDSVVLFYTLIQIKLITSVSNEIKFVSHLYFSNIQCVVGIFALYN